MTIDREKNAFDPSMWTARASGEYERLEWVSAEGPLQKMVEVADLKGSEVIVDVGTGSQAVLNALAEKLDFDRGARAIGTDISEDMLNRGPKLYELFVTDARDMSILGYNFADLVTARMVYHHIKDIGEAIREAHKLLKLEGRLIVGEYVAVDDEVWEFERRVFDIKEPGRHLWTGDQLAEIIQEHWETESDMVMDFGVLPQYSVRNWMAKSGLPPETQDAVLTCYLNVPANIIDKMGITITRDDVLVDRLFAYVIATKQ